MKKSLLAILAILLITSCAPQREFVRFGDAGTFRPGPRPGAAGQSSESEEEYDSYELIDHGAPNHGVPPMYGSQPSYRRGGYPAAVPTYDPYGNPQTIIVPNPW